MRLTQKNFDDLVVTQKEFAEALNHRMTRIENNVAKMGTNVAWIMKFVFAGVAVLTAVLIAVITRGI